MKPKYLATVFCITVLASAQLAFAESGSQMNLISKGRVSPTSHFSGLIVWSNIHGNDATFLVRTDESGLVRAKTSLSTSDECEQENLSMCFEGKIKSANWKGFSEGDTFTLGFDLENKKEYFSFTSGFLENVDVTVNLHKIILR